MQENPLEDALPRYQTRARFRFSQHMPTNGSPTPTQRVKRMTDVDHSLPTQDLTTEFATSTEHMLIEQQDPECAPFQTCIPHQLPPHSRPLYASMPPPPCYITRQLPLPTESLPQYVPQQHQRYGQIYSPQQNNSQPMQIQMAIRPTYQLNPPPKAFPPNLALTQGRNVLTEPSQPHLHTLAMLSNAITPATTIPEMKAQAARALHSYYGRDLSDPGTRLPILICAQPYPSQNLSTDVMSPPTARPVLPHSSSPPNYHRAYSGATYLLHQQAQRHTPYNVTSSPQYAAQFSSSPQYRPSQPSGSPPSRLPQFSTTLHLPAAMPMSFNNQPSPLTYPNEPLPSAQHQTQPQNIQPPRIHTQTQSLFVRHTHGDFSDHGWGRGVRIHEDLKYIIAVLEQDAVMQEIHREAAKRMYEVN